MFKGTTDIFVIKGIAWILLSNISLYSLIPYCLCKLLGPGLDLGNAQNWTRSVSLGHGVMVVQLQSTRQ